MYLLRCMSVPHHLSLESCLPFCDPVSGSQSSLLRVAGFRSADSQKFASVDINTSADSWQLCCFTKGHKCSVASYAAPWFWCSGVTFRLLSWRLNAGTVRGLLQELQEIRVYETRSRDLNQLHWWMPSPGGTVNGFAGQIASLSIASFCLTTCLFLRGLPCNEFRCLCKFALKKGKHGERQLHRCVQIYCAPLLNIVSTLGSGKKNRSAVRRTYFLKSMQ